MPKILIVKTSALGDVIQASMVAPLLKDKWPKAHIAWAAERAGYEYLQGAAAVDALYLFDFKAWRSCRDFKALWRFIKALRAERYDYVFDLQGNCKSALVTLFARGEKKIGFGKKSVAEWPNLLFTKEHYNPPKNINIVLRYLYLFEQAFKCSFPYRPFAAVKRPKIIAVVNNARWESKCLGQKRLSAVLRSFPDASFQLIYHSPKEKIAAEKSVKLIGGRARVVRSNNIEELKALLAGSDLFIGTDSAPLHLAAVLNLPTISFFGPTNMQVYKPWGEGHFGVQGICPYGYKFEKTCPYLRSCGNKKCINNFSLNFVCNDIIKKILD